MGTYIGVDIWYGRAFGAERSHITTGRSSSNSSRTETYDTQDVTTDDQSGGSPFSRYPSSRCRHVHRHHAGRLVPVPGHALVHHRAPDAEHSPQGSSPVGQQAPRHGHSVQGCRLSAISYPATVNINCAQYDANNALTSRSNCRPPSIRPPSHCRWPLSPSARRALRSRRRRR